MIATYISSTSFSVVGDKTATLLPSVSTRVDCGVDGYKYGSVVSRTYNGTITTVVVDGDALTANTADVVHGFSEPKSVVKHAASHATGGRDALTAAVIGALASGADINLSDYKVQRPYLQDWAEVVNARGSISGAQTIDMELGNVVTATITAATTFTFTNPPATGRAGGFVLVLTNGGAGVVTWPTSVKWAGGTAPTLTASGTDIISFISKDAGTLWYGIVSGKDVK